ncbi:MAG: hypothetical protein HY035_11570 [Nitrospirae bacterium]|nr:hypothetical protein [Nitrospirota bacterium]MBI3379021.1 hypothetical protein [Nitrospirota bacterium]
MTTKRFATEMRDTIRSIRDEQGISEIKCNNLIAYLDQVINSTEEEIAPAQMEKYKAELQIWVKQNEAVQAQNIEMFRSVILTGQNALKTAFLMNGGATVALLAFLGKLSDQHQDKIAIFASTMVIFVAGVLASTIASGATYLCQWFYAHSQPWKRIAGHAFNILTILLNIASYGCFIWGAFRAYEAFLGFSIKIIK